MSEAKTATEQIAAPGADGWYIVTDFFVNGGRIYGDLGPFESKELALTVRSYVEASPGVRQRGQTFAVDHWPRGWNRQQPEAPEAQRGEAVK